MEVFKKLDDYNAYLDFKIKSLKEVRKSLGLNRNFLNLKKEVIQDYGECYIWLKDHNFADLNQVKLALITELEKLRASTELDDKDIIMSDTLSEMRAKFQ